MAVQSLIDIGFNYKKTEEDKEKILLYLRQVRSAITDINGMQFNGGSLAGLMKNEEALTRVQEQLNKVTADYVRLQEQLNSAATASAGNANKQLDAFQQLNKEYKEAVANASKLGAELGIESQQFKDAAANAELLRQKIEGIKAATKTGGVVSKPVISTSNISNSDDEAAAANATGVAVSELEQKQAAAEQQAIAWANAQKVAGITVSATEQSIMATVLAYDKYTGTLQQNLQAQIENSVALAENKKQQKDLEDAYNAGEVGLDAYTAKLAALKEEYAVINTANKELSTTINNQVREFNAVGGSIDELQAQVANLQNQYEKLSATERNSPFGQELKAEIDTLEPRLKELEAELGKFQRNVGNYPKGSYNALKSELQQLTIQYNNLTKAEQKSSEGTALKTQIVDLTTQVKAFETTGGNAFQSIFSNIRQLAYILPGIGLAGIFNLIFEGITAAAEALLDFGNRAEKAAEQTEKVAAAQEKVAANAERIKKLETVDFSTQQRNNEVDLSYAKSKNETKADQLVIEQRIAEERRKQAEADFKDDGLQNLRDLEQHVNDATTAYEKLQSVEGDVRKGLFGKELSPILDDEGKQVQSIEQFDKALERSKNELDRQSAAYQRQKDIVTEYYNSGRDLVAKNNEIQTYYDAEQRKLLLESTNLEVKLTKLKNDTVLNDTRSSLSQRLSAIRSNAAAEQQLAEAQKNDTLNNPASSAVDKTLAVKKAEETNAEAVKNSERQQFAVREEYRKRDITANQQYNDTKLRQDHEYYDNAAKNPNLSLDQQLSALQHAQAIQQQILAIDHAAKEAQLKNTYRTQAELKADEADYQASITTLAQKGEENRLALIKSYNERVQQETLQGQQALKNAIQGLYVSDAETSEQYSHDVVALDQSLQKKEISLREYNERRKELDDDYSTYSLASQLAKDKRELANVKHSTDEELALRKKIADEEVALTDKIAERQKEASAQLKESLNGLLSDTVSLGQSIGDSKFEKQLNQMQALKDASDERYAKEIENIQNSTIAEEDKANRIKILEAEKAAQDDLSDKRQRELKTKQARFDKAVAVAAATAQGLQTTIALFGKAAEAKAEAALLAANPLTALYAPVALAAAAAITTTAIISAATTAANVGKLLATPIPTYAKGLEGNKGAHFGIFGEAGPELVQKPGMAPFIADKATLDYLPAGTRIKPLTPSDIDATMHRSMYAVTAQMLQAKQPKSNNDGSKDMERHTRAIVRAIQKNKPTIPNTANALAERLAFELYKRGRMNW